MMLAQRFQRPSRIVAACCLLALSGCANKVLNNQLANSQETIDQARIAGAAGTAPAELDAAVEKMDRARTAAKDRHGTQAMRLAQEAQVDANLARARTDSTQARIAATEIQKSNQILYEELQRLQQQRK